MPAAVAASRDKLRSRAFMLSYPRDSLLILTLTPSLIFIVRSSKPNPLILCHPDILTSSLLMHEIVASSHISLSSIMCQLLFPFEEVFMMNLFSCISCI